MSHSPLQSMSRAATTLNGARSSAPVLAARTSLVQRKCACGGKAGMDSECEECRRKRLTGTPDLPIQTKLTVGPADDRYEREADRVASTIMRMPDPRIQHTTESDEPLRLLRLTPLAQRQLETDGITDDKEDEEEAAQSKPLAERIQRQADTTEEEEDEEIAQSKPASGAAFCAPTAAAAQLRALRSSGGAAMPHADRSFFEPRFGHGFGAVRIHTGPRAAAAARTLHARAFTVGRDIVFGSGQYSPGSNVGRNLMAHELAHVVQQHQAPAQTAPQSIPQATAQRKADTAQPASGTLPSPAELTSGGAPLANPVRSFYEARLGRDLAGVRVHTGPEAALHSRSLQAHAFAYRNHIWLGEGNRPEPSFALSHELAHVVQQEQPAAQSASTVQRLPFWIPINTRRGKLSSGSEVHNEILSAADGLNNIATEVTIPNAIYTGHGLGLQGRADLYKAPSRIGVYFDGRPVGRETGNDLHLNPAAIRGAGTAAQPRFARRNIRNINTAPSSIELGELKPANLDSLRLGHTQLDNYKKGIVFARDRVNEWAAARSSTDTWNLPEANITRINDDPPPQFAYNPAAPRTDRSLALADFTEEMSQKGGRERVKFKVKKIYAPEAYLGRRIEGGLYAENFGQGLWMYYARPANLTQALNLPTFRVQQRQAYMNVAQSVQDEVIGNLTRGPDTIRFLPLNRDRAALKAAPLRVTPDRSRATVRRVPKRARLQDPFNYKTWAKRQEQLGDIVRGTPQVGKGQAGKGGKDTKKALETLQFLDLAAEAEQGLGKVPGKGTQRSDLPKKEDLVETIQSTAGGKKITHKRSLIGLYSWMEIWTGAPVRLVLGRLRQTFGSTFVTISARIRNLRSKVQKKFSDSYDKLSAGRSKGTGYGAIAVRAIGRALRSIVKLILPESFRLLVESLGEGLKQKLLTFFPVELDALRAAAENGFQQFADIEATLTKIKAEAQSHVEGVLAKFDTHLARLREMIDLASKIATTIKWAIRAIQCGTPPGWGCVKLLFSALTSKLVDMVISDCRVQRKIAGLALKLDFFKSLPATIADFVGEQINGILPQSIAPIFADVGHASLPATSEIGCDEDFDEVAMELEMFKDKLIERHGEFGAETIINSLAKITEKSGVGEDDMLSADQIRELGEKLIENDILPLEIEQYADEYPNVQNEDIEARLGTVQEFIDSVKASSPLRQEPGAGTPSEPSKQPPGDVGGDAGAGAGGPGEAGGEVEAEGPGTPVAVPLDKLPDIPLNEVTFSVMVLNGSYYGERKLSRHPGPPVRVTLEAKLGGVTFIVPDVEAKITKRNFVPNLQKAEKIKVELTLTKRHPFKLKLITPAASPGGQPTEQIVPFGIGPGGKIVDVFPLPPR